MTQKEHFTTAYALWCGDFPLRRLRMPAKGWVRAGTILIFKRPWLTKEQQIKILKVEKCIGCDHSCKIIEDHGSSCCHSCTGYLYRGTILKGGVSKRGGEGNYAGYKMHKASKEEQLYHAY